MSKEEYYQSSLRRRKAIREKFSNHELLYSIGKSLHSSYCSLTHFFHTTPDFLIIGAPKSATTALYQYLLQHPSIYPPLTKQIHFFDRYFHRGLSWYKICFPYKWEKFQKVKNKKLGFCTGEATVHYMLHPLAAKRVAETFPNIKLIVMLRNPIDRAYSHWNMMVTHKHENLSFEEAINKEKQRILGLYKKMETDQRFYSKEYFWYGYLERSTYINRLKKWFEYFPREQFLILKSEELFNDPNNTYKKVLEFLKLEKVDLENYKTFRKGKYKKEKMNSETRKKLIEYFQPYNMELYKLLNDNLGWDK